MGNQKLWTKLRAGQFTRINESFVFYNLFEMIFYDIYSFTEHIKKLLDDGHVVCGVFVDLKKAFDTVHHEILCDKLNDYGLWGKINDLLKSYLSNRKQYVSLHGVESSLEDITCVVPHGLTLGPLLFLLYINDFR